MVQLTNTRVTRRSDGAPDPDGALKEVSRIKIWHYRNIYLNHPPVDPSVFIPLSVDNTGHLYDEFIRLLFLHAHRESSALANELPEESDQVHFLRASCFTILKGTVGLITYQTQWRNNRICGFQSPLDLCSKSSLPCWVYIFILSLVSLLIIDLVWHLSFPWSSSFFILMEINY